MNKQKLQLTSSVKTMYSSSNKNVSRILHLKKIQRTEGTADNLYFFQYFMSDDALGYFIFLAVTGLSCDHVYQVLTEKKTMISLLPAHMKCGNTAVF